MRFGQSERSIELIIGIFVMQKLYETKQEKRIKKKTIVHTHSFAPVEAHTPYKHVWRYAFLWQVTEAVRQLSLFDGMRTLWSVYDVRCACERLCDVCVRAR